MGYFRAKAGVLWFVRSGVLAWVLFFLPVRSELQAKPLPNENKKSLVILHTNDLHSHYKPTGDAFGLGGIARLATQIRQERATQQENNVLLLDGGDWAEGNIYYNLGVGRTSIELMNELGYDASVVGNHDWLNGPDRLLELFNNTPPQFALLGANLNATLYARARELKRIKNDDPGFIQNYTIIEKNGVRVGIIGLLTFEFIYDKFFSPIKLEDPFSTCRKLARDLKFPPPSKDPKKPSEKPVDLVIVISHNGLATNRLIAGLPYVDVVIHAHDHAKISKPIEVSFEGKTSYIVEAEKWGHYLGRMDLEIDLAQKKTKLKKYKLIQIDSTIEDDPSITAQVEHYDAQIRSMYGDIFQDHLAQVNLDLRRAPQESLFGNALTDAYRDYSAADLSFEQMNLASGEIYAGAVNSVDVYNAFTSIFNLGLNRSWTLKIAKIKGETLDWLLNLVLTFQGFIPGGLVNTSGLYAQYDPIYARKKQSILFPDTTRRALKVLEINGRPVEMDREYKVALSQGVLEIFEFIEHFLKVKIPYMEMQDTGKELWQVFAAYLRKNSPFDGSKISRGKRIVVLQQDLAVYHDEVQAKRQGDEAHFSILIRNLGSSNSTEGRKLKLAFEKTPQNTVDDPYFDETTVLQNNLPIIQSGDSYRLELKAKIPPSLIALPLRTPLPVYIEIDSTYDPSAADTNPSNDGTWITI